MFLVLGIVPCSAQQSPAGLWQTIDDRDGQPRAEIRITINSGILTGRVVRSLRDVETGNGLCAKCPGDRRDQPIIGMAILTGLRQSSDTPLVWRGGEILDPDSGGVYGAKATLSPSGTELTVRGFLGTSLFGRSQVWRRVAEKQ